MKFSMKFALVTGLQVACLIGMIGYKYASLASGTEVTLEVPRPKDPRSLFSGDYVIIRYAINEIDLKKIPNDLKNLDYGMPVYVELEPKGAVWVPKMVRNTKPEKGVTFIKGKLLSYRDNNTVLSVDYGIENYFVPENTGREMEKRLREVQKAVVSIDPSGKGTVVRIPEK